MKNALLVPCVFFGTLLGTLLAFTFFGGIELHYDITATFKTETAGLLFFCMLHKGCTALLLALMLAVIGVYAFLMRHSAKLDAALGLFLVCVLLTIVIIIPLCYTQLPTIKNAMHSYQNTLSDTGTYTVFINKPLFLTLLQNGADTLFYDAYTAYLSNMRAYLFFIYAFFFFISSFWSACTITRWNMFNLLLLFLLAGTLLLIYPYMRGEGLQILCAKLHININNSTIHVPLLFCMLACVLHTIGSIKILLKYVKHKNASKNQKI